MDTLRSFDWWDTLKSAFEETGSSLAVVVLITSLCVPVVVIQIQQYLSASTNNNTNKHHRRKLSYTSNAMAAGSFPENTYMPETIINAVALFDIDEGCPTVQAIADQVITPMLQYSRLNSIPDVRTSSLRPSRRSFSSSSLSFTPTDLIRVVHVVGDETTVLDTITAHLQDPLTTNDRGDLPWWEILLIHNGAPQAPSACVLRVHHALADGISLMALFATTQIITYVDGSPIVIPRNFTKCSAAKSKFKSKSPPTSATTTTTTPTPTTTPTTNTTTTKPSSSSSSSSSSKPSLFSMLCMMPRDAWRVATLGLSRFDDDTAFRQNCGVRRSGMTYSGIRKPIFFPAIPLDFVKQLKNAAGHGITVNDVLMTVFSQTIVEYCAMHPNPQEQENTGTHPPRTRLQCRALLPVAFPRAWESFQNVDTALNNQWCFFSADLAITVQPILERLYTIHQHNLDIWRTPRVWLQMQLQNRIMPWLPRDVGRIGLRDIMTRHSVVFSNVPGPQQERIRLAGTTVQSMHMLYANLIPQVGILSYAGKVYGNIMVDPTQMMIQQQQLPVCYARAFQQLASALHVPVLPDEIVRLPK